MTMSQSRDADGSQHQTTCGLPKSDMAELSVEEISTAGWLA